MKKILLSIAFLTGGFAFAQNNITTTSSDAWTAWMSWFDLQGNYVDGSAWSVPELRTDLVTSPTEDQVILYPNYSCYNSQQFPNGTDPYWFDQTTGDAVKILEASTYVEPGSSFNGVDLTFTGNVVSHTLDVGYDAKFFIKALDPANGYADVLNGAYVTDLPTSGDFTVTVSGAELASGLIVQYGFSVKGVCANPADEAALGNVVIEGSTLSVDEDIDAQFSMYPNPTSEILNIENNGNYSNYVITSALGSKVKSGALDQGSINLGELNNGIYFISLSNNEGKNTTKRFVKK